MRILIDDLRTFEDYNPPRDLIFRDPSKALEYLVSSWVTNQYIELNNSHTELYLDHDLGEGMDTDLISKWLGVVAEIGRPYPVKSIIIVTQNPVAREKLKNRLHSYPLEFAELPLDPSFT